MARLLLCLAEEKWASIARWLKVNQFEQRKIYRIAWRLCPPQVRGWRQMTPITLGGVSAVAEIADVDRPTGPPLHRLTLRRVGARLLLAGIVLFGLAWPML
jgi:hypothetical protein